jgi:hypothetical protein
MKTLIVGLLSLTVLAACATPKMATQSLPPAGQGFCNANDGIFVVLINNKGEKNAFVCPKIKGKPIGQEDKLPPKKWIEVNDIDLGSVKKFALEGDPDPCLDWVSGGRRHYICW